MNNFTDLEAARFCLRNEELKTVYEQDGYSLENLSSLSGVEWFDIVSTGASVGLVKYAGKNSVGEDCWLPCTSQERENIGPRHFVGYGENGSTLIINKAKVSSIFKYLDCLSDKPAMDEFAENDAYAL